MNFETSMPSSPILAVDMRRLPEKGLMDPYPILQSIRTGLAGLDHGDDGLADSFSLDGEPKVAATTMARSDIHDWERQLQENRSRARDMSTASMRREPALRLDGLDESPRRPNLHGRAMHIPTRTR